MRASDKLALLDDEDLATIGALFAAWLGREFATLEEALGVAPRQSQWDPRTSLAFVRRNEAVRAAAKEWKSAGALARALKRYRDGAWRHDRLEDELPDRLAHRPERFLWRILKERDLAVSKSSISRIVSEAPRCRGTADESTVESNSTER